MTRCDNKNTTISSMSSLTSYTIPLDLLSLETSSSNNCDTCVGSNNHNGFDNDINLVLVHWSSLTSIPILITPSDSKPTSLSSNLVPSAHRSVTNSRSSPLLGATRSSTFVLNPSSVLSWLSSNAYVLDTISLIFNPNDISIFMNLYQLYLVLLLESSHFLGWYIPSIKLARNVEELQSLKSSSHPNPISYFFLFHIEYISNPSFASSTIIFLSLALKIYCDFNLISLVLMIIHMIIGLCWFPIMSQLRVMNWDSIQDFIQATSCTYSRSSPRIIENNLQYIERSRQ